MYPIRAGSVLLLGLCLAMGCASNEVPAFEDLPEVKKIASAGGNPMGIRLAIAPIVETFDRDEINKEGTNKFAVEFDPRDLRNEFVEMLNNYGLFESVGTVEGANKDEWVANAFEAEFDVVMELNLKQFDVNFVGTNGWYAPNLINFALFVWTAWWVTDEVYGANVEIDMKLWSAHSGQRLWNGTFKSNQERELDDFERGWKLTGSIFIPSGLKAENWQKIHEVVMPFSVQEVKSEILTTMHGEVRDYSGGRDFASYMEKRMAVIIGVNRHDGFLIHNLRYADQDAQAFYDFLTDDFRGLVPAKNIRLFQNHTATRENVRDAFKFINKYSRADDTVYVYFAGYGSLVKDEMAGGDGFKKYLVLYDTDVDKLSETALSIDELDSLCDGVNARNVVIILDTSFNVVDGETRTYVDVRQPAEEVTLDDEFLKTLAEGDGRLVLSACTTEQGALMLDEEQHGLFTHYFIEATHLIKTLAGEDGVLTLQEVLSHAIDASIDRADIEGQEQEPKVYGEGADGIDVAWLSTGEAPPEEDEPAPEEDEAGPPADE